MSGRPGHNSQEGYPSSSPSSLDAHQNDPFSPPQRRYYDNDSEDYGRRDTYASDNSNTGFYDQNGAYDPYRAFTMFSLSSTKLTCLLANSPTRHRLRWRCLRPTLRPFCGVVGRSSDGQFRIIDTNFHRLRSRRSRCVPCLEFRAPNSSLQGGNRRHIPRPYPEIRISEGFHEKYGLAFRVLLIISSDSIG